MAIEGADYVFGCVDNDGVRFFINEACVAYEKPLIDLASDVPEPGVFGGHVAITTGNHGCLHCLDLLDPDEVRRYFSPVEWSRTKPPSTELRRARLRRSVLRLSQ